MRFLHVYLHIQSFNWCICAASLEDSGSTLSDFFATKYTCGDFIWTLWWYFGDSDVATAVQASLVSDLPQSSSDMWVCWDPTSSLPSCCLKNGAFQEVLINLQNMQSVRVRAFFFGTALCHVGVLVPASVALLKALVPGHGGDCRGHVPGPARSRPGCHQSSQFKGQLGIRCIPWALGEHWSLKVSFRYPTSMRFASVKQCANFIDP